MIDRVFFSDLRLCMNKVILFKEGEDMSGYTAVKDNVGGNIKVSSNSQVNSYPNTSGGYEHFWYNPNTGKSGWHGDAASKEDKRFMADVSNK